MSAIKLLFVGCYGTANLDGCVMITMMIVMPQLDAISLHPLACKILLVFRLAEGKMLSWPEHTVYSLATCSKLLANYPQWDSNTVWKLLARSYSHKKVSSNRRDATIVTLWLLPLNAKSTHRATQLNWTDTVWFSTNWQMGKQGEPTG